MTTSVKIQKENIKAKFSPKFITFGTRTSGKNAESHHFIKQNTLPIQKSYVFLPPI